MDLEVSDQEVKRAKVREQVGILLLCIVLAGSGFLLLRGGTTSPPTSFTEGKDVSGEVKGSAAAAGVTATKNTPESSAVTAVTGKININTASIEDLDRLPGVGPATAQKIIDYRKQNGPFPNIEAIDNVSGIGPSKYAQMKDLISI
jgi:competence protein ComEA